MTEQANMRDFRLGQYDRISELLDNIWLNPEVPKTLQPQVSSIFDTLEMLQKLEYPADNSEERKEAVVFNRDKHDEAYDKAFSRMELLWLAMDMVNKGIMPQEIRPYSMIAKDVVIANLEEMAEEYKQITMELMYKQHELEVNRCIGRFRRCLLPEEELDAPIFD